MLGEFRTLDKMAYNNVIGAIKKNSQDLSESEKIKKALMIEMIYEIFRGLPDKGEEYRHSYINLDDKEAKLFTDDYNASFGPIVVMPSFYSLVAESYLNFFSHIRVTQYEKDATISGLLDLNDRVVTKISGKKENGKPSEIEIDTKDYVYNVKGLEFPYLVGLLAGGVVSKKSLKGKENTRENREELVRNLLSKYPFLDRYDLYDFINKNVNEFVDLHYYDTKISNYVIEKSLEHFLNEIEMGYIKGVSVTKEEIKGLDVGKEAIEKFKNYEVTDIYGTRGKLIDVPLYLHDVGSSVECPFMEFLSKLPDDDLDVFIVGLCYFANYCGDLGRVDGRNRMGALCANWLRGKKLNTAIKSSVLGVSLADYVNYRRDSYYKSYDYQQESDFMISEFYRNLGFTIDTDDIRDNPYYRSADVWAFRNMLPYMSPDRRRKY